MLAQEKIDIITSRIHDHFTVQTLRVIDDSDKHIGHAGHQGGGRHFTVEINADELNICSRVEAHRKIYALLTDLMPDEVHALKINILKD